jgi:hypothetical protein
MDASCMSNEATTPHAVNRRKVWSSSNTVAALRYLLGFLLKVPYDPGATRVRECHTFIHSIPFH